MLLARLKFELLGAFGLASLAFMFVACGAESPADSLDISDGCKEAGPSFAEMYSACTADDVATLYDSDLLGAWSRDFAGVNVLDGIHPALGLLARTCEIQNNLPPICSDPGVIETQGSNQYTQRDQLSGLRVWELKFAEALGTELAPAMPTLQQNGDEYFRNFVDLWAYANTVGDYSMFQPILWPEIVSKLSEWGRVASNDQKPTRVDRIYNVEGGPALGSLSGCFESSSSFLAWPLFDESRVTTSGKTYVRLEFSDGRVSNVELGATAAENTGKYCRA